MMIHVAVRYRAAVLVLASTIALAVFGRPVLQARGADDLAAGFAAPSDAEKPWVYWWWLNGNVTEEMIRSDLAAMKEKGVGGLLLFDARGYHDDHCPPPPVRMEFMGPEWRRMLKVAMAEASRLGLTMSVNLSSCAGALKGPWDVGDDAPKQLAWATSELEGPKKVEMTVPAGDWKRMWEVGLLACRRESAADKAVVEVVDLSDKVDGQGRLAWQVPPGRWTLLRLVSTIMEDRKTEVDILSREAVAAYFNRMGKAILDDAGPLAGKTLTHFYSVSWEGAAPTWTPGFDKEFERYRGYSIRPYLPVLAGMTVQTPEVSKRFLEDYRRTIGHCFLENCYGTLRELCHRAGLAWHSESGGPWNRKNDMFADSDQLAFWASNDMPQGEFWWPLPYHTNARSTAIAAHIYGKPVAAIEAFTHMRKHWSAYPATLKPRADAALCDGMNHFIWHTFTCSLPEFGVPGAEYFAGTHLNPRVTWWRQAGDFLAYLARSQHMLRQGHFVADVCCYVSDRNYAGWTRGEKWGTKPSLVLGKGYTYDLVNTDVLRERLAFEGGRLVLPDGMQYRLLVVDLAEEDVPPEALQKILDLAEAGATVVLGSRQASRAPGLKGYPQADAEVGRLVKQLWGDAAGPKVRQRGRGKLITGTGLDTVLASEKISPDFAGPWDYIHRHGENADIYFLSGTGDAECTFRVAGKEPELWDPVAGRICDTVAYRSSDDGRTVVPIRLAENGSVFVVFRKPATDRHVAAIAGPADGWEIVGRDEKGVRLRFWKKGSYAVKTASKGEKAVEVDGLTEPRALDGPWDVRFTPGWGAPESAVFERLIAWNEHPNAGIKYFSGTGTYRKSVELSKDEATGPVRLELGRVGYVAEVRLNGKPVGVVWTAPWVVDLTGKVKAGTNALEIDVANVWQNRLIGDAGLPEKERLTKSNLRLQADGPPMKPYEGYSAKDPLAPSGLMGPVRLEFGCEREVGL